MGGARGGRAYLLPWPLAATICPSQQLEFPCLQGAGQGEKEAEHPLLLLLLLPAVRDNGGHRGLR